MKNMCVKVEDELYEKVKQKAELMKVSLQKFMHESLMKSTCDEPQASKETSIVSHELYMKLHEQLDTKDAQIDQLHQLLAIEQKNAQYQSEQVSQARMQLEDLRKKRSWWSFWRNR